MKKNRWFAVALLVVAAPIFMLAPAARGQAKDSARLVFPEQLLEGDPNFSLALHLQGDIRGNVGPCG